MNVHNPAEGELGIHRAALVLLLLLGIGPSLRAQTADTPYFFTTLAGLSGCTNGPVQSVRTTNPVAVAFDASGNLYFAESYINPYPGYAIKKVTPAGVVLTLATGPQPASIYNGGRPIPASISVAADPSGNVYFTGLDDAIRRISSNGIVTVFAGSPGIPGDAEPGEADGSGASARFNAPGALAIDGSGNVYVADVFNFAIRRITPDAVVSTLSWGGPVGGLALDNAGNLIVTDPTGATITRVAPGGLATVIAGTKGVHGYLDGVGAAAQFARPVAVAVDKDGDILVADGGYNYYSAVYDEEIYFGETVRRITPGGVVTTLAGDALEYGFADGTGTAAQFGSLVGIAVDGSGRVFVADSLNGAIREVSQGGAVSTFMGPARNSMGSSDGAGAAARFRQPSAVCVDGLGNAYVADTANHTIRKITRDGLVTTLAGSAGSAGHADGTGPQAQFAGPAGVAVDSGGNIYVADTQNATIRRVTPGGVVSTLAGTAGVLGGADGTGASAKFYSPTGIAVDASGTIYVADTYGATVRKVTPSGTVTTLAGGATGEVDGTGTAAGFSYPQGIAVDAAGNLYVCDSAGGTIRRVTPGGVVTTIAGKTSSEGTADGTGTSALFLWPEGIAVDAGGNLFVADLGAGTIRRITPAGVVSTVAGVSYSAAYSGSFPSYELYGPWPSPFYGAADGMGPAALFSRPSGVAVDSSGNVFVADSGTNTIRIGASGAPPAVPSEPYFDSQPASQAIAADGTAVFVAASGSIPSAARQWSLNGTPIAGAAGPALVVSNATALQAGDYLCTATNALGVAYASAVLAVDDTPDPGRLINLSSRSYVGSGGGTLIAGFVVGGRGTAGSQGLLLRASGPALAAFGSLGAGALLPDPDIQLVGMPTGTVLAGNSGWGGAPAISSAAFEVGAFAWSDPKSHDSALLAALASGSYTALVYGASGDSGLALAEIYDATAPGGYSTLQPRLLNLSARAEVGTGGDVLIAGFVIGGATSRTVLIRASGPSLASFGLSGVLPDPLLTLNSIVRNTTSLVATDAGWAGDAQIAATAASLGAFAWGDTASADSALLVTLAPGAYTAEVSGASGDTGVALVEIYEVN